MTPNQADREAAADWCEAQPFPSKQAEAPAIRAGEYDHHSLVQAFAAHRRAALEEAARVAESLIPMPGSIQQMHGTPAQAVFEAAQAIRALIDKEPT